MQHTTPAAPAVRETLERILSSETFARSERARELLRYLVEQEQAGEAERLKGFAIAVDVFGRAAGFDPSTDAVVRVQAGRLRELLSEYYATEGAAEPLRIQVARGSYVPAYEATEFAVAPSSGEAMQRTDSGALPEGDQEPLAARSMQRSTSPRPDDARPPPSPAQMMRHVHLFWAAMGIVIAMLGFLVYRMAEPPNSAAIDLAAIAEATLSTSAIPATGAAEIAAAGARLVQSRKTPASQRVAAVLQHRALRLRHGRSASLATMTRSATPRRPTPIRFVFSVSPGPAAGSVTIDLQNVATGKVLLSRVLRADRDRSAVLDDRIADIVSATIPVSGTIYAYIDQTGLQSGLIACLLLNDEYYLDQKPDKHEAAYRCLEKLAGDAERNRRWSIRNWRHCIWRPSPTATPIRPAPPASRRWRFAHRAVQMGATSPYAHRAYGFLNSRVGSAGGIDPLDAQGL